MGELETGWENTEMLERGQLNSLKEIKCKIYQHPAMTVYPMYPGNLSVFVTVMSSSRCLRFAPKSQLPKMRVSYIPAREKLDPNTRILKLSS
jgi:hypothetical protein